MGQRLRLRTWIALGIILVLSPIVLWTLFKPEGAGAEWWNDNWMYRKKVPISNSGSTQTDFQVQVTIDTATLVTDGKLQSDCDDLRFTDKSGKLLPYWLEPTTCNTAATLAWVKVPSIPSAADIYYYYGNPSTGPGSSNTSEVFIREMESAAANWPLDDTTTDQSYARVLNPADSEGRDIVINGDFDEDASWSKGTGWTISDGTANGTTALDLSQSTSPLVIGKSYEVIFTVSNYSAGNVWVLVGSSGTGTTRSADGTYTETITCAGNTTFTIRGGGGFTGSVDDVSVKQVNIPGSDEFDGSELLSDGDMEAEGTSAWTAINNSILSKETITPHGGLQLLRVTATVTTTPRARQSILTAGHTYRLTGYTRSDGTSTPVFCYISTSGTWSCPELGTTSTSWQYFDTVFTTGNIWMGIGLQQNTGYAEYDDVSVTEIDPLSGSIPTSASGNRPTIGTAAGGHLSYAYSFDGSDYVNFYSSDLNSVFNPDEGTITLWAKPSSSDIWTDSTTRNLLYFAADANNRFTLVKSATDNLLQLYHNFGGTAKSVNTTELGGTDSVFQIVVTWNKSTDQYKAYINGSQTGSTQTGLGTWSGNFSTSLAAIGCQGAGASMCWSGLINDVRLYGRALSDSEIADLYNATTDRQAYYTENYTGRELIRQYSDAVTVGSAAAEENSPGPVAWWKFDEGADNTCSGGSNDVCDSTQNGNDGAFGASTAAPTWKAEDQCVSGKCLWFDGTDDVVTVSNTIGGVKTVSFWTKVMSTSTTEQLIDLNGTDYLTSTSGTVTAAGFGTETIYVDGVAGTSLSANKWHYISVTTDSSLSGSAVKIGQISSDFGQAFIDEVKIYPYARSEAEIKEDYNAGAAVLGAKTDGWLSNGLVGYWKMDETSGTTVADASGNGNTGTLTNAQETGTSDGSGNTTTTLVDTDGTLSSTDDAYNGMILSITDDGTCPLSADAERVISDYDQASKTFTVSSAFSAAPDTCVYTVLHQVGGKFGNGMGFDYVNDYVSTITSASTSPRSLFAWVRRRDTTSEILYIAGDSGGGSYFGIYSGTKYLIVRAVSSTTSGTCYGTTSINDTNWHHVGFTMYEEDGEVKRKLYVDGIEGTNTTCSQLPGTISSQNHTEYIGKTLSNYFKGTIDEVRLYNRALSPTEVAALYKWAPGPVGYWDFNEGSGTTAYDRSGNGNNGTLNNSPSWISGKYGEGLAFDGIGNQNVNITDSNTLSVKNVSMSVWAKITGETGNYQVLAWKGTDYEISLDSNLNPRFGIQTDGGRTAGNTSGYALSVNTWYYLTLTFDGTTIKGYLDGKLIHTQAHANPGNIRDSSGAVIVSDASYDVKGIVDDVRIYNYARTPEQIMQDMNAGTASVLSSSGAGGKAEPIAHWKFDEQQGQTTNNSAVSGSSLNGTLGANSGSSTDDPTWKTQSDCKNGGCLSFDGGDYTNMGDPSNGSLDFDTRDFSTSAWVKTNGTVSGASYPIVSKDASSTARWYGPLILGGSDEGKVRCYISDNSDTYYSTSTTLINDSLWHYLSCVFDRDTKIKIFIDGKEDKITESGTITSVDSISNSTSLYISYNSRLATYTTGFIDDIKIYNFALTAEQVKQDYNSGLGTSYGVGAESEASLLTDGEGNPPIAEWKMDENTGDYAYDTSGNGNTGTLNNSPAWKSSCQKGACLSFNTSDVSSSTGPNPTSAGTIEAWVKVNSWKTNYDAVVFKGPGIAWADIDYGLFRYSSNSQFLGTINNGTNTLAGNGPKSSTITIGVWYHLAFTWDSDNARFYTNGKLNQTVDWDYAAGNRSSNLRIGRAVNGSSYPFNGEIDDVKIYDYARTPAQIAYDYNRGEPVAHYRMDECEGATIHDVSGNGNDGTLTIGGSGEDTVGTCQTSSTAWGSGATGKFGSSVSFDGSDDYIDIGDIGYTSIKSVSFWAKPDSTTQEFLQLSSSDTVAVSSGTISVAGFGTETVYVDGKQTTSFSDTNWHHVVIVSDTDITANDMDIGRVSTNYGAGLIDDVRIYNYALSADQIKQVYNGGKAVRYGD